MPSNRALIRRLRSVNGPCGTQPFDPGQESDRRRFYLAEELLKIRAEVPDVNLSAEATSCLAAAEILYPEPPEENANV